jgi:hypothetical protein
MPACVDAWKSAQPQVQPAKLVGDAKSIDQIIGSLDHPTAPVLSTLFHLQSGHETERVSHRFSHHHATIPNVEAKISLSMSQRRPYHCLGEELLRAKRRSRNPACLASTRLADSHRDEIKHRSVRLTARRNALVDRQSKRESMISQKWAWHAWRQPFSSIALLLMCGAAFSQSTAAPAPQNSRASAYGSRWECNRGFLKEGNACVAVKVPANAYLNSSGSSWYCDRGFLKSGETCVPVTVPQNAYADDGGLGAGWQCNRGFRQAGNSCARIVIPENAYALDSTFGNGWECSRGYRASGASCTPVNVPANAFLVRTGDDWKCERGYLKAGAACAAVQVPANGYLDSSGNDWKCNRGFQRDAAACVAVAVPTNAYIDYSGSAWRCADGFRKQGAACIAER